MKRKKRKNAILAVIQENNPEKLRERTVKPEKGKGRKERPRKAEDIGDGYDRAA